MGKNLHIGIILDGNRRFARKKGLAKWKGHDYGANKINELFGWAIDLGIRELTLYSFSIENFNRNKNEKKEIFKLFKKKVEELLKDERINKKKIRINFIGRLDLFPEDVREKMKEAMERTIDHDSYIVNFAMGYGGRSEIVDAVKKICKKIEKSEITHDEIDEDMITDNLYLKDDPDMIIRPGGEKRVSNFLIWQGNYSEWYFCDKLWPEFTKEDMKDAISELKKRERRFGR